MGLRAEATPLDNAKRLFKAGDYFDSSRLFYQIMNSSGGDIRSQAEFGLARSLLEAGFPYGAAFFFGRLVQQGAKNDLFRPALEALSEINARTPLGRASIAGLMQAKLEPLSIPATAQGFYFYYKGLEAFDTNPRANSNLLRARADLDRVPPSSPYFSLAKFQLGLIFSLLGNEDLAIDAFKRSQDRAKSTSLRQLARINLARAYYERKDYKRSLEWYAKIPRESDLWLQTLLEGAWAFFMLQKHNNTLGNIHTIQSPFFQSRFYPESYILSAISFVRLCRYDNAKKSLEKFSARYGAIFSDLNTLRDSYKRENSSFYDLIANYSNTRRLNQYTGAVEIIDSVSRSDGFKEGQQVVRGLAREKSLLRTRGARLDDLAEVLKNVYEDLRVANAERTGQQAFDQFSQLVSHLRDLNNQVKLIDLELLGGITDALREEYRGDDGPIDKTEWGEGMRPLKLGQQLEYWPFEGEYWEDELGAYVYNIESKCSSAGRKGKSK